MPIYADHAATHSHYRIAAGKSVFQHGFQKLLQHGKSLAVLSLRYGYDIGLLTTACHCFGICRGNAFVGDDQYLARQLQMRSCFGQNASFYNDIVPVIC